MAEELIYEDTDKRIFVTAAVSDDTPQEERVEWVNPDAPAAKLAALEARVDAAAALAADAQATAQDVAEAMKPSGR